MSHDVIETPAAPAADPEPSRGKPVLDAIHLRMIAEWASGYRGIPVWFVARYDETGQVVIHMKTNKQVEEPDTLVIPCNTRAPAEQPLVTSASMEARHGDDVRRVDLLHVKKKSKEGKPVDMGPADAVFWSASAVEKFLVPYYASVYGSHAEEWVRELLDVFEPNRDGAAQGKDASGTTDVFAIAHIPRSEYIDLADDPSAALRFFPLHPASEGGGGGEEGAAEVESLSFRELMGLRRPG